ncbi:MAG: glycosyltransferase family 2 protein [Acidobacteria bacterium]|nr:glycosyltransferase family 2 protein [Acidobacteriota bacterium]
MIDEMAGRRDFSVVIPFFQRRAGILTDAVTSALSQQDVPTPLVIVVDDESPVDPAVELADLLRRFPDDLVVLRQDNQGPGAARNTGIRHARTVSRYIALLDSDDTWLPRHLSTAATALQAGAEFYFCDISSRQSGARTKFEGVGFPPTRPDESRGDTIDEYPGDWVRLILTSCPINTSTVVFNAEACPFEFRTDLRVACEDYYFFLQVAASRKRIAFSTTPQVKLGLGVNIYAGVKWGSAQMLEQLHDQVRYIKDVMTTIDTSRTYHRECAAELRTYRLSFWESAPRALRGRDRSRAASAMGRMLATDPAILLSLPRAAVRLGSLWLAHKFGRSEPEAVD